MVDFGFNINVNFNPGNAIAGLAQFNTLVDRTKAGLIALSQGQVIGGGIDNFVASAQRAVAPITGLLNAIPKISNAMAGISQGANQAGNALAQVGGKAQAASSSIQSVGTTVNSVRGTFSAANVAIVGMGTSMETLGAKVGMTSSQLAGMSGPLGNIGRQLQTANQQFQVLGNTAAQTGSKFSAALAPITAIGGGPLNNLNSQLAGTTGGLNNAGAAATNSATGFGRLREMFTGNRGLVFGLSATFGTITGVVFEMQLMTDASKQVADSQAVVNDLIAQGKQGTAQYSQAVQALGKDQRFLEFSSRNMALAITNLIPDVLLITNGIIQLTDKFRTTGAAAAAAQTGFDKCSNSIHFT